MAGGVADEKSRDSVAYISQTYGGVKKEKRLVNAHQTWTNRNKETEKKKEGKGVASPENRVYVCERRAHISTLSREKITLGAFSCRPSCIRSGNIAWKHNNVVLFLWVWTRTLYMTSDLVTVPQLLTDLYTFHWIDGAPYKISILMLFALWTTPFFLILCTSWQLNMYLRISHLEHCESLLVPATKECVHQVYQ